MALSKYPFEPIQCWPLSLGAAYATTPVHLTARRRGGCVAARGGPAAGAAGDRVLSSAARRRNVPHLVGRSGKACTTPAIVEGENVRDRISLGGGSNSIVLPELAVISFASVRDRRGGYRCRARGKGGNKTIPIVFVVPVTRSTSVWLKLNRPGGNVTGVNILHSMNWAPKRLQLLRELVPTGQRSPPCVDQSAPVRPRRGCATRVRRLRLGGQIATVSEAAPAASSTWPSMAWSEDGSTRCWSSPIALPNRPTRCSSPCCRLVRGSLRSTRNALISSKPAD